MTSVDSSTSSLVFELAARSAQQRERLTTALRANRQQGRRGPPSPSQRTPTATLSHSMASAVAATPESGGPTQVELFGQNRSLRRRNAQLQRELATVKAQASWLGLRVSAHAQRASAAIASAGMHLPHRPLARQAGYSESGAAASQVRLASHKRRSSSADVAAQRQIMDALTQSQAEVEDAPTTLSGAQDELWTASAWVSLTLTLTLSLRTRVVLAYSRTHTLTPSPPHALTPSRPHTHTHTQPSPARPPDELPWTICLSTTMPLPTLFNPYPDPAGLASHG